MVRKKMAVISKLMKLSDGVLLRAPPLFQLLFGSANLARQGVDGRPWLSLRAQAEGNRISPVEFLIKSALCATLRLPLSILCQKVHQCLKASILQRAATISAYHAHVGNSCACSAFDDVRVAPSDTTYLSMNQAVLAVRRSRGPRVLASTNHEKATDRLMRTFEMLFTLCQHLLAAFFHVCCPLHAREVGDLLGSTRPHPDRPSPDNCSMALPQFLT